MEEKETGENVLGMVEEMKRGLVSAVKKYSPTDADGIDLFAAVVIFTAQFMESYCDATGLPRIVAMARFTETLGKALAGAYDESN